MWNVPRNASVRESDPLVVAGKTLPSAGELDTHFRNERDGVCSLGYNHEKYWLLSARGKSCLQITDMNTLKEVGTRRIYRPDVSPLGASLTLVAFDIFNISER
jgi:hypothetical protein